MKKRLNNLIIQVKSNSISTKIFYVTITVSFVFLMCIAISPLNKIKEFNKLIQNDSSFFSKIDKTYNHPDLSNVLKEKTFKEALLKLSVNDSIQLVLNLSDSTVSLHIKGVKIHQAKISQYKTDALFRKLSNLQYIGIFKQALKISEQYASFEKEPIVVRQAPKNELEAALNAQEPDIAFQKPTYAKFSLDYGINLIFEQDNNPTFYDKWIKFKFYTRVGIKNISERIGRFMLFKNQIYHPEIQVKVNRDDIQALYRALPENAFVVIYLN